MLQQQSSICITEAVTKNDRMDIESEVNKVVRQALRIALISSICGFFANYYFACQVLAQGGSPVLQGSVKEQNYLGPSKNPGLNFNDLKNTRDSFGTSPSMGMPAIGEGESFEPPPDAFNLKASQNNQVATANPPGLAQPSKSDFSGEQAVPGLDTTSQSNGSAQQYALSAEAKNDPDNSPEMQLAWDEWHKRVASAVYDKFNAIAQMAFKYSQPLACYVTYTVTRDGRIINVDVPQKSPNVAFNAMVVLVINSISGQTDLLCFPAGSRRTVVNKAGMFTQNYGVQGFKYTTGDRETLPGH